MKEWFKKFFAVDNSINENTVMGVIWALPTLVGYFLPMVTLDVKILMTTATLCYFGLNLPKR